MKKKGNVETYWTHHLTHSQHRLRWLDHILRMGDERIPKSLLYSELVGGRRKRGRPTLRFKDVCKRDLQSLNVGIDKWEELANDRDKWPSSVYRNLKERDKQFFKKPKKTKNSNWNEFCLFCFFFVALLCLSCFSLVYFTYKYFWAQSRTVDFGWQRAY